MFIAICSMANIYGRFVPGGPGAQVVNDVNVQRVNVTDSMKSRNTKLCVVGHYFCCTIL